MADINTNILIFAVLFGILMLAAVVLIIYLYKKNEKDLDFERLKYIRFLDSLRCNASCNLCIDNYNALNRQINHIMIKLEKKVLKNEENN